MGQWGRDEWHTGDAVCSPGYECLRSIQREQDRSSHLELTLPEDIQASKQLIGSICHNNREEMDGSASGPAPAGEPALLPAVSRCSHEAVDSATGIQPQICH